MADNPEDNGEAYEVGYGKPPKEHQFRPGQSGNPKGRPRGSRGLKTILNQELDAPWTIQINGKPVTGSKQQLMIKTLTARAASGDLKAISKLVDLILQVFGVEDRGRGPERLSPRDIALLRDLLGGLRVGAAMHDQEYGDDDLEGGDVEGSEEDPDE